MSWLRRKLIDLLVGRDTVVMNCKVTAPFESFGHKTYMNRVRIAAPELPDGKERAWINFADWKEVKVSNVTSEPK